MSVTVHLTLEQLAEAIAQLAPEELETLEILLNPGLTQEILRRSREYEELKHQGQLLTLAELQAAWWEDSSELSPSVSSGS
jgi:hypothetical protein